MAQYKRVLIKLSGEALGEKINAWLMKWHEQQADLEGNTPLYSLMGYNRSDFLIDALLPRFGTGEGKAVLKGSELALSLGFASPKIYAIPEGLTVTVENDGLQVTVKGISKELVGEAAARIRAYYPAEPYKGKGIKYVGEHIRRKQGKKVA